MSGLFLDFSASGYSGKPEKIFCTDTDIFILFQRHVLMDMDNRRFRMIKKNPKRGKLPFLEIITNNFFIFLRATSPPPEWTPPRRINNKKNSEKN
jgi:hypothetical protein